MNDPTPKEALKFDKVGQQLMMPVLKVEMQKTTSDGVEMGVLENGMPYLSQRGVVAMSGVPRTTLQRMTDNWGEYKLKGDGKGIQRLLEKAGYHEDSLYIEIEDTGKTIYAYPEPVVLAVLEHYAFDSKTKLEQAQDSYRKLTKAGFRYFVYEFLGYKPKQEQLDKWKHFHDRVDLVYDASPQGYFSIFREISGMIVTLIRSNVIINDKVIPDLSVGKTWANYWKSKDLSSTFGERVHYAHNYPNYYPQSLSNPQPAWAYPEEALAEFRKWFRREYITSKFPAYMLSQVAQGKLIKSAALGAITAINPERIEEA